MFCHADASVTCNNANISFVFRNPAAAVAEQTHKDTASSAVPGQRRGWLCHVVHDLPNTTTPYPDRKLRRRFRDECCLVEKWAFGYSHDIMSLFQVLGPVYFDAHVSPSKQGSHNSSVSYYTAAEFIYLLGREGGRVYILKYKITQGVFFLILFYCFSCKQATFSFYTGPLQTVLVFKLAQTTASDPQSPPISGQMGWN